MVELFEQEIKTNDRQSSKGNQLKWFSRDTWYKADYTGYEGLAEYIISNLLQYSTLDKKEYVLYETEELSYKYQHYLGCRSKSCLEIGWQMITLERLFQNYCGESLNKSIYSIREHKKRIEFLVEQTERITGLKEFGIYMSKLLTLDAFFLNEDRHTHNIAVLMDGSGNYDYCPIFDNGAALLSDITMDYLLCVETEQLMSGVKAKTFCQSFEEQLDIVESLYGQYIHFTFDNSIISALLKNERYYSEEIKTRIKDIIIMQKRKYSFLF